MQGRRFSLGLLHRPRQVALTMAAFLSLVIMAQVTSSRPIQGGADRPAGAGPARGSAGMVWAWGDNYDGELGGGKAGGVRPYPAPIPGLTDVTAVSGNRANNLGLTRAGAVLFWGASDATSQPTPLLEPRLKDIVAVAAGGRFGLALRRDGTVFSFGDNLRGELGTGTTADAAGVAPIKGLTGVSAIAAGDEYGLALTRQGRIYAWGDNSAGQLGLDPNSSGIADTSRPQLIHGLPRIRAIAAGATHSLAVGEDGHVYAWGENGWGELGDGTTDERDTPIRVPGLSGIIAVAAGVGDDSAGSAAYHEHSLALRKDGTVVGWGDNSVGELGDNPADDYVRPAPISGVSDIIAIAAGGKFSAALRRDGAVLAWGANRAGQLGAQTTSEFRGTTLQARSTPRVVPHIAGVVAIAAGDAHVVALVRLPASAVATALSRLRTVDATATVTAAMAIATANAAATASAAGATTVAKAEAISAATAGVRLRATATAIAVAGQTATVVAGPRANAALAATVYAATRANPPDPARPATTPAPVIQLEAPPRRLQPLPASALAASLRCGRGDLDISKGRVALLAGDHYYPHVCVRNHGVLIAGGALTLRALTISVDATSVLLADGTVAAVSPSPQPGCARDRASMHLGAPGAGGRPNDTDTGTGGYGGGVITLIARHIVLNGLISADGTGGGQGAPARCPFDGCPGATYAGGDGGGGGSIRIVAHDIQFMGHLSAVGGAGGPPGDSISNQYGDLPLGATGTTGGAGCVKLVTAILRARPGSLDIAGPLLLTQPGHNG